MSPLPSIQLGACRSRLPHQWFLLQELGSGRKLLGSERGKSGVRALLSVTGVSLRFFSVCEMRVIGCPVAASLHCGPHETHLLVFVVRVPSHME